MYTRLALWADGEASPGAAHTLRVESFDGARIHVKTGPGHEADLRVVAGPYRDASAVRALGPG